jgi:thiol-disulfide isomerase/thioredoxin
MASVGDVVVGGCFEPPESDQSLWNDRHPVLRDLLGTKTNSMKNSVRILMIVIVAALAASCAKEKPKDVVLNAVPTVGNEMPAFSASMTDSTKVFFKDLKGKVFLIFFNPDCDHCQREAEMLSKNKSMLTGYEVYFVTPDKMEAIAKFAEDYDLLEPNIHFGRANVPDVIKAVGPINQVPTFFIYRDQKLVARNEGELALEKIQELLK